MTGMGGECRQLEEKHIVFELRTFDDSTFQPAEIGINISMLLIYYSYRLTFQLTQYIFTTH